MGANNTLVNGISPEHVQALVVMLGMPLWIWLSLRALRALAGDGSGWAARFIARYDGAPAALRTTSALLLATGLVHLALPLGHRGAPLLNLSFLVSGAAFMYLAVAAFGEKPWRGKAALLLLGSIGAYLVVAGSGWQEEPDQVGIATKLIELTALGLVVIPAFATLRASPRRFARPAASLGIVFLTLGTGLTIWVGSFVAHGRADASAESHEHLPGTPAHSHASDGHTHEFLARAQAGTIMRRGASGPPTLEQFQAAAALAEQTRAGVARYQDYNVALAEGYVPDGPMLGVERHFKHKAYEKDGLILDPNKPEKLVYASDGTKYVLLGVAYTMQKAGEPGPEIGGSLTRWHSHNICVTVLPPAFGLVSPFGTCPFASVALTLPDMMHVWTIDYPGGPYADKIDDKFVKNLLANTP